VTYTILDSGTDIIVRRDNNYISNYNYNYNSDSDGDWLQNNSNFQLLSAQTSRRRIDDNIWLRRQIVELLRNKLSYLNLKFSKKKIQPEWIDLF